MGDPVPPPSAAGYSASARVARRRCFLETVALACAALSAFTASAQAPGPELIERLPGAIDDHAMVLLDARRAVVAWERDDGVGHETVWSSRRSAPGTWTVPEILEFSQGRSRSVQLAALDGGAALAVWVQDELALDGLWTNRYAPRTGWLEPSRIEPVGGELYAPRLALAPNGRGWAVWERREGNRLRIRASPHTPELGWQTPRTIDSGDGDAVSPQVAVHADGGALIAWTRARGMDGARRRVVASRLVPGSGWDAPRPLSGREVDAYDVRIAMDPAGNAFAAWQQDAGEVTSIFASRFAARSGWGAPERLEMRGRMASGPRIAVDGDGNATVVWIRLDGESGAIVAARYVAGSGWREPVVVQDDRLRFLFDLDVAAAPGGEVLAAWCRTDGSRNNVWFARFDSRGRWRPAALAEHRTGSAHRPRVAAAADGSFAVIWKMVDAPLPRQALYSLWFRRLE